MLLCQWNNRIVVSLLHCTIHLSVLAWNTVSKSAITAVEHSIYVSIINKVMYPWIERTLLTYLSTTILLLCGGVKHYPEKLIRIENDMCVCHGQRQDTVIIIIKQQKNIIPHHRCIPTHAQSNSEHMIWNLSLYILSVLLAVLASNPLEEVITQRSIIKYWK